nr:hypothetical protein B0A51_11024 [Rachicladosporium sp. CCFEE 5018]
MAPHADEPKADSGVDLIQHDGEKFGDWRDEFHKTGTVLIKGVVSEERAKYYQQKQIEWLQSFGRGFDPNDESTWTADHLPVSFKGGMYFGYASNHEKYVWESRMEPKVVDVFEKLWGTKELIASFDGQNITLPRQKDLTWSPWPHCDQAPSRKGMQCVQGLLNWAPNGPNDGGLIVMKGSSKLFDQFFAETREQDDHEDKPPEEMKFGDLFIFKETDVKWFEDHGCEMVKMNMDPGDLVLWDSRTMHYACFPQGNQIRHVQYVCYTPRKFAKEEDMAFKAELFKTWQGTTKFSPHWPHCNIRKSGVPMRNGVEDPSNRFEPLEKPDMTPALLRYAAVESY